MSSDGLLLVHGQRGDEADALAFENGGILDQRLAGEQLVDAEDVVDGVVRELQGYLVTLDLHHFTRFAAGSAAGSATVSHPAAESARADGTGGTGRSRRGLRRIRRRAGRLGRDWSLDWSRGSGRGLGIGLREQAQRSQVFTRRLAGCGLGVRDPREPVRIRRLGPEQRCRCKRGSQNKKCAEILGRGRLKRGLRIGVRNKHDGLGSLIRDAGRCLSGNRRLFTLAVLFGDTFEVLLDVVHAFLGRRVHHLFAVVAEEVANFFLPLIRERFKFAAVIIARTR